jgi:uncharacterized zinc-type alcohol dehydrogenase-like protein
MATNYPIVPGHEIVGRVTKVGSAVTSDKPGDLVAVGCMVDSDRTCRIANVTSAILPKHDAHFHLSGQTSWRRHLWRLFDSIVVDEHFALRLPSNLNIAGAAPLLCAGIYYIFADAPLGRRQRQEGRRGRARGLGHMAVKFGRAFGARRGLHHVA